MSTKNSLLKITENGVFWSAVQSWGNRIFTTLLSIILARILTPKEYGIASAAVLALNLIPLIAEMGFSDSIMQRKNLKNNDVNLPFFISIVVSVFLTVLFILFRKNISDWVGLGDNTIYLIAILLTVLISVPTTFQEAMYKRNMQFRSLALRSFTSSILGGVAGLISALYGLGIWVFVIQGWVSLLINVAWIWSRPQWTPSFNINFASFKQMLRFGLPILMQRIIDFFGTRTVDMVIISQIGLTAYGFFVVGSRFYQIMMQLLQSVFYDVSLTILSTIAHDSKRIAQVYLKAISLAAKFMSPIFVFLAAIAPEICTLVFGDRWANVDKIASPLLIMGAVHCVQYMNGSFLSSRGRPELTLITGVTRSVLQVISIFAIGGEDVNSLTITYILATLSVTPLSFYITTREIGIKTIEAIKILLLPIAISATSFSSVHISRDYIKYICTNNFVIAIILGFIFILCHLLMMFLFDKGSLFSAANYALSKFSKNKGHKQFT